MIPIKKSSAPRNLAIKGAEAARLLCEAYSMNENDYHRGLKTFDFSHGLYGSDQVKTSLKSTQNSKCAFCESIFTHTGFGDVEHYRPKGGYKQAASDKLQRPGYYWLAYDWDNLFYSCQLCNQQFKKNMFPLKVPRSRAKSHKHDLSKESPLLIHPARNDISSFIGFRKEYAYPIGGCREGISTIEVFGLNRDALVENRRRRLTDLGVFVDAYNSLRDALANKSTPNLLESLDSVEKTLQSSKAAGAEYSAMSRAYLESNFLPH